MCSKHAIVNNFCHAATHDSLMSFQHIDFPTCIQCATLNTAQNRRTSFWISLPDFTRCNNEVGIVNFLDTDRLKATERISVKFGSLVFIAIIVFSGDDFHIVT
nr:MAG TPA: hypothetical protein [Bacteriophage sp.]